MPPTLRSEEISIKPLTQDVGITPLIILPADVFLNGVLEQYLTLKEAAIFEIAATNKLLRLHLQYGAPSSAHTNAPELAGFIRNKTRNDEVCVKEDSNIFVWLQSRNVRLTSLKLASVTARELQLASKFSRFLYSLKIVETRSSTSYSNQDLLDFIHTSIKLRTLDLSNTLNQFINDNSLLAIADRCKNLRNLALNHLCDDVSNVGLRKIAEAYQQQLESLQLSWCWKINDIGLHVLSEFCPQLKRLEMPCCCRLSDEGLIEVSKRCKELEYVDFSRCTRITESGISSLLTNCSKLHTLVLAGTCVPFASLTSSVCPSLKSLKIAWSKSANDASIARLTEICPNLTALDVSQCDSITDVSMGHLASNCSKLRELQLAFCELVTDAGLAVLGRGCTQLVSVDVSNCSGITATGLMNMIDGGVGQINDNDPDENDSGNRKQEPKQVKKQTTTTTTTTSKIKVIRLPSIKSLPKSAAQELRLQFPQVSFS